MSLFFTEYRVSGLTFSSYVWAATADAAARICMERGIGESLADAMPLTHEPEGDEYKPASWHLRNSHDAKVTHSLVWLGNLALSSRACSVSEVLGDCGFVHEAIHLSGGIATCGGGRGWGHLEGLVCEVERRVPGYLP